MKLIIDIPENILKKVKEHTTHVMDKINIEKAIANGTPIPDNATILSVTEFADKCRECGKNYVKIPDNATNGDVIKTMFPNEIVTHNANLIWYGDLFMCNDRVWNAPYQKGGK